MKSWKIRSIIIFMFIAMLVLVAIQINWISKAIKLQEENFNYNIYQSLDKVVNLIENQEAIRTVIEASEFAFDALSDNYERKMDNTNKSSSNSSAYFIDPLQAIEQNTPKERRIEKDTAYSKLEQVLRDSSIVNAKNFSSQMMAAFAQNKNKSIPERINLLYLDSVIKSIFIVNNILIPYQYEIKVASKSLFDQLETAIVGKNRIFGVRLFPNDLFEQPHYLVVKLERQTNSFFKNIANLLILSFFTIFIIGGSFLFAINGLLKQKRLSEMKTDFVNNMTHELKTPIATIALASEALAEVDESFTPSKISKYGKMIFDENQRLKQHVERILNTSMLNKEGFDLHLEIVDLNEAINLVIDQNHLRFAERNAEIRKRLDAFSAIIEADKMHLMNIFYNIFDNSLKYSKSDLVLTVITKSQRNGVLISISDNGIGMSSTQQKRVFDKFYRVPTGAKHDVKGFGLGLTYVKNVVEAHGGYISVESELNKGTTFFIFMPFKVIKI